MTDEPATITRLIGIYNANGTPWGELAYWIGARLGRGHCPLCDITHGNIHEKPEWRTCRDTLPVPFDAYHRNDQPDHIRHLTHRLPAVMADTTTGPVMLLGPDDLTACHADPHDLIQAINTAADREHLAWPNPQHTTT